MADDDQRSSFMTNRHLPPVGGTSFLCPWFVCLLSAARYARCILILWEFRFPHLGVCLLWGTVLSVVRGLLRLLYLNSLGVPIPIPSSDIHIPHDQKNGPSNKNTGLNRNIEQPSMDVQGLLLPQKIIPS